MRRATLPTAIPELSYITSREDPSSLSTSVISGYPGCAASRAISEKHVIEEAPVLVTGPKELPTSYDSPGVIISDTSLRGARGMRCNRLAALNLTNSVARR